MQREDISANWYFYHFTREASLPLVFLLVWAVTLMGLLTGCGDKQTSDPGMIVHFVTPPEDPCSQLLKSGAPLTLDSIKVGVRFGLSLPAGTKRYLNLRLTAVSGANQGQSYPCQMIELTVVPEQDSIFFVSPRHDLPDGTYSIVAYLFETEEPATICDVSLAWQQWPIEDTYYQKGYVNCGQRILVQYDCMSSYNILYGKDLLKRLNSAFGEEPASDTIALRVDKIDIVNSTFSNSIIVRNFLRDNWEQAYLSQTDSLDLYLAGLEDYDRTPGAIPEFTADAIGAASGFGLDVDSLGRRGSFSLLFVKRLRMIYLPDDYKQLILRCATHEMGHSRARLTHANQAAFLHDPNFKCVMISRLDSLQVGTSKIDHDFSHFCGNCLQFISVVDWP